MKKALILFGFVSFIYTSYSQDPDAATWRHIDTSILKSKNLSAVYNLVQQLRQKSLEEKKYFRAGRCWYYQLLITDQRTEDSLYFGNSAFIDSILLSAPGKQELVIAMHMLQAKRLAAFSQRYLRFNRENYELRGLAVNYAAYKNEKLDSLSQAHYEQAKQIAGQVPGADIGDALWLSSDPLLFLFKPALSDIVIAEQVNSLKKNYYSFVPTLKHVHSLDLSQDEYIAGLEDLNDEKNSLAPLKLYKEWMNNQKGNPAAYYFIETLARKFLYETLNGRNADEVKTGKGYEGYLLRILSSPVATVKAHAVYQLCLLWNQQSKKYSSSNDEDYLYRGTYRYKKNYDTAYRYHALKALRLFEQNKSLLDSFAYLKGILTRMEEKIRTVDAGVSMQEYNLPGEPMLAGFEFKNAEKLFYSIVRVHSSFRFLYKPGKDLAGRLRQLPEVTHAIIDLPAVNDYNNHAAHLKIDPLPAGNYALLFSHQPLSDSNREVQLLFFKVTSLAVVTNNNRVFVLNRKTGFPLPGAMIRGSHQQNRRDTSGGVQIFTTNYTVNKEGFAIVNDSRTEDLEVSYHNDTCFSSVDPEVEEDKPEDVFDKEEYEDLVEFYEENATAEIFTDRSIYRPGQTVHFKAIFLTKNKDTGEPVLMSRKNMKGSLFNNVYKKWLKESEPMLFLTDPFGREVDSVETRLNDYGSISGSFKIPKTAATGDWSIEPDYIDAERNDGQFKVEEYKRPSYEISIENPKKELSPGNPFTIKVVVKSFAGAALNNVRINYTVERNSRYPEFDSLAEKETDRYQSAYVADTFAFTDNAGELAITVSDSPVKKYAIGDEKEWNLTYTISAEAIDVTGESYETESVVRISSRPVEIRIPVPVKFDRSEKISLAVSASDENAGRVNKDISVKIYRVIKNEDLFGKREVMAADQWLYPKQQLEQWFPLVNFSRAETGESKSLVFDSIINTGGQGRLDPGPSLFGAGNYLIEAVCNENGRITGRTEKRFSVFDQQLGRLPERAWNFYRLSYNSFFAGDTIRYENGNSETPYYSIYHVKYFSGKKKVQASHYYEQVVQDKGIHLWKWMLPKDAVDQAMLTQVYVVNNEMFTHQERIYINNSSVAEPEIIIEQYRKKLSPGSRETFVVSVKTKDVNTVAELMTTLYDASLDKLNEHKWIKPEQGRSRYINTDWPGEINSSVRGTDIQMLADNRRSLLIRPAHMQPLWWINQTDADVMGDWNYFGNSDGPSGFGYYDIRVAGAFDADDNGMSSLMGRVPGVQIASTKGLEEVVVIGYGTSKGRALSVTGSLIRIRGSASLSAYSQPLIILDGIPYEGDLSKIDPAAITQGIILKGADATAIYGARAANGVLVLSTKGEIVFPVVTPDPLPPPRKNFNETAFFFPAVYADKDGYYRFSFTMPESVTEWNWKLLAHTKNSRWAYVERKLNTQLPLMVQPHMPRLLYQGDRIVLQSRISNLDTVNASGRVTCKIEDMLTGDDVTLRFAANPSNDFSVMRKENVYSAFEIKVPRDQLNPVKITISARAQNFADGEEHIIPVLSRKVLLRNSQSFYFANKADTVISPVKLSPGDELYGVGISVASKPQSALINSLPWLANYSFDCAEQTFNKLFAHLTAYKMMRVDKETQLSFENARQAVEKEPSQREQLPDELSEQAMPWMSLENNTARQQKQLFELLDTGRTVERIGKYMGKLYKLQNSDGGLTWFDGGKSNTYISNYLLAGFGKLRRDSLLNPASVFEKGYADFIKKLVKYSDGHFWIDWKEGIFSVDPVFYAYARSYWVDAYSVSDSAIKDIRYVLTERWEKVNNYSLYNQVVLVITTLRYFDKNSTEYSKAIEQLNSIEQLAIRDNINGTRWKDLADSEDMSNSSEETLALIAQAFSEAGTHPGISPGIIKWLLNSKSENRWSSTKATSAVIELLKKENKTVAGPAQTVKLTIDKKEISVTDDLLSGNGFSFLKTNKAASPELVKQNTVPASGNITWYYFTENENAGRGNGDITLKRELFRLNTNTSAWEPVDEETLLKIADRIRVVLTIENSKALRYVYIDDKRAAAFEPAESSSGYRYAKGIDYYLSVRDAGMQFFSEFIASGKSVISYEMKVMHEGDFSSGPAFLQCMYKPEMNAYSNTLTVRTGK